jgi:hypothetical protein
MLRDRVEQVQPSFDEMRTGEAVGTQRRRVVRRKNTMPNQLGLSQPSVIL